MKLLNEAIYPGKEKRALIRKMGLAALESILQSMMQALLYLMCNPRPHDSGLKTGPLHKKNPTTKREYQ